MAGTVADRVSPLDPPERGGQRILILTLLALGIALLVVARFNAISGVVLPFLQQAADPTLYALDFGIRHSVVPDSSPFFTVLAALRLDLTHPVFVIASYLIVTLLAGYGVVRIIRRLAPDADRTLIAALLFALIFADAKLIDFNKSSWISEHNFSFTFIAAALRFWFVYYALDRRYVAMAALLIPINMLSFKVGWPLLGFAGLILLHARVRSPWPWLAIAASLVVPAIAALRTQGGIDSGDTAAMFALFNALHAGEDNPFAGPWFQAPLFLGGSAIGWWLAGRLDGAASAAIRAILFGSLIVYVVGGLYLSFGGAVVPLPLAVLLSPARALETASFVIYLLVLLWIARTSRLQGVERPGAMLAAILLKVAPDGKWVVLSLAVAIGVVALAMLRRLAIRRGIRWPGIAARIGLPLGIALVAPLLGAFFALNLSGQRGAYRYDPSLGFYDAATPANALPMLRSIAREPDDRRLLFVWERNGTLVEAPWSTAVRKSGIDGDLYYLGSPATIARQARVNRDHADLLAGLNAGAVDPGLAARVAALCVTLVMPRDASPAVGDWRVVREHGAWVELVPPVAPSDARRDCAPIADLSPAPGARS